MATPLMMRAVFYSSCALFRLMLADVGTTTGRAVTGCFGLTKLVSKPVERGGTAGTATLLSAIFIPRVWAGVAMTISLLYPLTCPIRSSISLGAMYRPVPNEKSTTVPAYCKTF